MCNKTYLTTGSATLTSISEYIFRKSCMIQSKCSSPVPKTTYESRRSIIEISYQVSHVLRTLLLEFSPLDRTC